MMYYCNYQRTHVRDPSSNLDPLSQELVPMGNPKRTSKFKKVLCAVCRPGSVHKKFKKTYPKETSFFYNNQP